MVLFVVFAVFAADVFAEDFIYELAAPVEPHRAAAVAAVPQSVVPLSAVGSFVVHQEHILLLAGDIRNHAVAPGSLLHVPDDFRFRLPTVKFGTGEGPEFGEIKLIALALVPVGGQELAF